MTINVARMQATALRLLTQNGQQVTIKRPYPGAFDTTTGSIQNPGISLIYMANGYPYPYNFMEINNTSILTTDVKFIMYCTTIPYINDVVTLNNEDLQIINVQNIGCQGKNIVWLCQLRV